LLPVYHRRPGDEVLASVLVDSYATSARRLEGLAFIDEIRASRGGVFRFEQPGLYNNIASLLLDAAMVNSRRELLRDVPQLLNHALERHAPDDPRRRSPLFNLFRYLFISADFTRAKNALTEFCQVTKGNARSRDATEKMDWFRSLSAKRQSAPAELASIWPDSCPVHDPSPPATSVSTANGQKQKH
jgi:hypothetical protein